MMLPFLPESALYRLRLWWLGLWVVVFLSGISLLMRCPYRHGSLNDFLLVHHHWCIRIERHLCVFTLLLLISYSKQKAAWWLAVGIIGWKLRNLWWIYFGLEWGSSPYSEFTQAFSFLPGKVRQLINLFIDGYNPFSVVLYCCLYGYWLLLCLRVLHRLPGNQPRE